MNTTYILYINYEILPGMCKKIMCKFIFAPELNKMVAFNHKLYFSILINGGCVR